MYKKFMKVIKRINNYGKDNMSIRNQIKSGNIREEDKLEAERYIRWTSMPS